MKILIVQNTDWINRNPAQQHHLAEMLSLRGHEIRAIDYEILWRKNPDKSLRSQCQIFRDVSKIHQGAKVTVIRPGIIKIPLLDYFSLQLSQRKEIDTQIKEFKPDIVVGMGLSGLWAQRACRKYYIPFINYWIDVSHRLIPSKFIQPVGWMIEKTVVKKADKVITINEKLKDYVISIGAKPGLTNVVRAGISIERFDPALKSTVRNSLNIKNDDFVLFFMGWLYNFAGLKEIVSQLAKNTNPKLKLLIVGEGDAYSELQKMKETLNLKERLLLVGQKPYQEIPSYIGAGDICILPSYPWEPIMHDIVPIKLYEYMAMKKPVISTRLPGVMKEFGADNGMIYVDKAEDIIGCATELISKNVLAEMGAKARIFAEKNSWNKITDEFENILKEVIKEK